MGKTCIGQVTAGGKTFPISKMVRANGFLFVSGQMPLDDAGQVTGGEIQAQTEAAIQNVKAVLALAGADLSHVVKVTAFILNKADFAGFNAAYARHFSEGPPARSTLVTGFGIDVLVEIECIAIDPGA